MTKLLVNITSGTTDGFIVCITKMQHISCTKSISMVGRHMCAVISMWYYTRMTVI